MVVTDLNLQELPVNVKELQAMVLEVYESQGTRKLLSGDWLYVHLSEGVANAYTNYLSGSDCLEASDRKPSVRADLVDRVENFEEG